MANKQKNASRLKGDRNQRVFIGGSYNGARRNQLSEIANAVLGEDFIPIVADEYLTLDRDIHTNAMALLHNCGYAVFELSELSGALMEIERVPDYAVKALVLFNQPSKNAYLPSRMLSTFIDDHLDIITMRGYVDPRSVSRFTMEWLRTMKGQTNGFSI